MIVKKYSDMTKNLTASANIQSPYLGKTLQFTDGTTAYVTLRGVLKPYDNKSTVVQNSIKTNIPWTFTEGDSVTLPNSMPLLVGSSIKDGESIGFEGTNIQANMLTSNPNSKYIGCYPATETATSMNVSTLDECQNYALDNNFSYFGLQNMQDNGFAKCNVYNELGSQSVKIWSSEMNGDNKGTLCFVTATGKLVIKDMNGKVVWETPNELTECKYEGRVNPDTIQGSYGGNCVGKPLNIDCGNPDPNKSYSASIIGNLNTVLKNKAMQMDVANWSYNPIVDFGDDDPAFCCSKKIDYSYQCGNGDYKTGQISAGSNILFDCNTNTNTNTNKCFVIVELTNDGYINIINNDVIIWSTNVLNINLNKQSNTNTNTNTNTNLGKYGRSYLQTGETLSIGEWIQNGNYKLIMQDDGNLVIYMTPTCTSNKDIMFGTETSNSIYQIGNKGDKTVLGKIGYIDSNSTLQEYPESMIGFIDDYQIHPNMALSGTALDTVIKPTHIDCQTACNQNSKCSAYSYQQESQTCWLYSDKTSDLSYTKNDKVITGVRKTKVLNNIPTNNVDTTQFDKYIKGDLLTNTPINPIITDDYNKISNALSNKQTHIAKQTINRAKESAKLNSMMQQQNIQFNNDVALNDVIKEKIQKEGFVNNSNSINNPNSINNSLSRIVQATNLKVVQENYKYILWSTLAICVLVYTIKKAK